VTAPALARAQVVHRTHHRMRLAFPHQKRNIGFFVRLERQLAGLPQTRAVRADPLTGSVLVFYEGPAERLLEAARERGLFAVQRSSFRTPLAHVHSGFRWANTWLRSASDGRLDLESVAMFWLVGAGLWQVSRGQVLPAGFSLLWQAGVLGLDESRAVRDAAADLADGG
jgi:hypothetical protein